MAECLLMSSFGPTQLAPWGKNVISCGTRGWKTSIMLCSGRSRETCQEEEAGENWPIAPSSGSRCWIASFSSGRTQIVLIWRGGGRGPRVICPSNKHFWWSVLTHLKHNACITWKTFWTNNVTILRSINLPFMFVIPLTCLSFSYVVAHIIKTTIRL